MFDETIYEGNPFIRVVDELIDFMDDDIYALASLSHLNDHNFVLTTSPSIQDTPWLVRAFNTMWIQFSKESYSNTKWLLEMAQQFNGPIYNIALNPEHIDNTPYGYDYRIGCVGGNMYWLEGEREQFLDVASIARDNNLDIGIINVHNDDSYTISTKWKLTPSYLTPGGEDASAEFHNAIWEFLGANPKYNKVSGKDISNTVRHMAGLFTVWDEIYVDDYEKKALFVFNDNSSICSQIKALIKFKDLKNIEYVTDSMDLTSVDVKKYDYIFFMTNEYFYYQQSMFLQKIAQEFKGETFNLDALPNMYRDVTADLWERYGVPAARAVRGFGEIPDIPFSPPYVLRAASGQDNKSNPTVFYNKEEMKTWPWWTWVDSYAEFVVQQFIDTSIDGKFYLGRALFADDTILPSYAMEATDWNCRLNYRTMTKRSHRISCFEDILPGFNSDCYAQIRRAINMVAMDAGCLDFGIKDGVIIPWEFGTNFGYDYSVHHKVETCRTFATMINLMMAMIECGLRLSDRDAEVILEEANLETRLWHYPPTRH